MTIFSDFKGDEKEAIENFQSRLTKAEHSVYNQENLGYISPKEEPNAQYEILRRRIGANTQEFWSFVSSEVVKVQKQLNEISPDLIQPLNHVLKVGAEHKRSLLHDLNNLAEADGYALWREKESNDLSDLVQRRFKYLQNPPDCNSAKKLVCSLNKVSLISDLYINNMKNVITLGLWLRMSASSCCLLHDGCLWHSKNINS